MTDLYTLKLPSREKAEEDGKWYPRVRWEVVQEKWTKKDVWGVDVYIPPKPSRKKMVNYGKKRKDRKWKREPMPEFWEPKNMERFASKHKLEGRWWDDEETMKKLAPEQWEYRQRQFHLRENGMWIIIDDEELYFPGEFWHYLQWWHVASEFNDGYPSYTRRDLDFWLVAEQRVELDPMVMGLVYPAFRREGKSYKAGLWLYKKPSIIPGCRSGVQSQTEQDAKDFFTEKVVRPWRREPAFFKADSSGTTNPAEKLVLSAPARRLTKEGQIAYEEIDHESIIDHRASNRSKYDGYKINGNYVNDECGKNENEDVVRLWHVVKECLTDNGRVISKALFITTVGEVVETAKNGKKLTGGAAFRKLWEASNQSKLMRNGKTQSGMIRLFMPVTHGYRGDDGGENGKIESFIDEFGNSNIEAAEKYWTEWREDLKQRGDSIGLNELRRKFPMNEEDLFLTDSGQCLFDSLKIESCMERLKEKNHLGVSLEDRLTMRYDLIFENPAPTIEENLKLRRKVRAIPNPRGGRFQFKADALPNPDKQNAWYFDGMSFVPRNSMIYEAGVDPFMNRNATSHHVSKAAAFVARVYDPMVDGDKPQPPGFTGEWKTHSIICRYVERERLASTRELSEDMAKLCLFMGCRLMVEINKTIVDDDFRRWGMANFLRVSPSVLNSNNQTVRQPRLGGYQTALSKEAMVERMREFVAYHAHPERMPFASTWSNLLRLDIDKTEKYDEAMGLGWTLLSMYPESWLSEPLPLPEPANMFEIFNPQSPDDYNSNNFRNDYIGKKSLFGPNGEIDLR